MRAEGERAHSSLALATAKSLLAESSAQLAAAGITPVVCTPRIGERSGQSKVGMGGAGAWEDKCSELQKRLEGVVAQRKDEHGAMTQHVRSDDESEDHNHVMLPLHAPIPESRTEREPEG